jgi:hypothetical protein
MKNLKEPIDRSPYARQIAYFRQYCGRPSSAALRAHEIQVCRGLYQEPKLQVRRCKREKVHAGDWQPERRQPGVVDGLRVRPDRRRSDAQVLTIVDDANHEAVAIEVERAIAGHGVVRC